MNVILCIHCILHNLFLTGERPFKCESCKYLAANQHEVTRHARQVHNGPKPLCCPYCQYKTADRSNYKKHVELHLNPRQFLCPVCKYAASKKCNLQYHIKSRHPGCDIAIDVSKVKLRVKKNGSEMSESNNTDSSMNKFDISSNFEEDDDDDNDDDDIEEDEGPESPDKQSSPINLSIKKGSKPNPVEAVESEPVKTPNQCEATPVKEKPTKAKDKAEKKMTPKQKKIQKICENAKENSTVKDSEMEKVATLESTANNKAKKRSKKHPVEKTAVQDKPTAVQDKTTAVQDKITPLQEKTTTVPDETEITESMEKDQQASLEKDQVEREKSNLNQDRIEKESVESLKGRKKETEKLEKNEEQLRNEGGGKENKIVKKPRNSKSKNAEKVTENVSESPQSQDSPAKNQAEKVGKTKAVKRKAVEALDLSTKPSSDAVCAAKAKRLKPKAAGKPQSNPSCSENISKTVEPRPAMQNNQVNATAPAPVKPKKTKKINKKTPDLQETVVPAEVKKASVSVEAKSNKKSPGTELSRQAFPLKTNPTPDHTSAEQNSTEFTQLNTPTNKTLTPTTPEKISDKSKEKQMVNRSSGEETPSPVEGGPPPTFRRPLTKPTTPSLELPAQRGKPADADDDEGIHSSHEGGSDISDSASEGSDDSGLNGAAPGLGKMPNDPETPTDEIPTPTELKSHTCIFCDRTFPLEVEYRRHLNRHLVNVYYMDNAAKGGK